ncbi:hypothetical protein BC833DRAFT_601069 [Globomyces pollinis-pini]|nr:hypothetical protein BC833DRAFT_601069 [Globomyces pollinis-pini]
MNSSEVKDELTTLLSNWKSNLSLLKELQHKAEDLELLTITPDESYLRYKELQKENNVLNLLLKQYESTLDVIMKKFRAQTVMLYLVE